MIYPSWVHLKHLLSFYFRQNIYIQKHDFRKNTMRWYSFKEKEKVESSSNSLVVLVVPMFEYASNLLVKMNICFQKQQNVGRATIIWQWHCYFVFTSELTLLNGRFFFLFLSVKVKCFSLFQVGLYNTSLQKKQFITINPNKSLKHNTIYFYKDLSTLTFLFYLNKSTG